LADAGPELGAVPNFYLTFGGARAGDFLYPQASGPFIPQSGPRIVADSRRLALASRIPTGHSQPETGHHRVSNAPHAPALWPTAGGSHWPSRIPTGHSQPETGSEGSHGRS
jgi:hypothetical protein